MAKVKRQPAEAKVNAQGVRLAKVSERLECFGGTSPIKSDDATLAPVAFLLRKHIFSRRHETRMAPRQPGSKKLYLSQKDELYLKHAFKNSTTISSYYNYRLAP